ncbi:MULTISPECIES: uroporphyrinogen decarboxylase [Moraxella]|uniref:Uroporphyrinogen decarboxylase n=1 Tax=Moraxella lacunata TaxID=477 RepID=A0A1B8PWI3_MORLA|nr:MULTISPECIES: uroporphyrinogen decarboxylase [Moraxella]MBE9577743.1 uroporphyrinogen decarboxylase [Moraxella sp. K1664]MBE9587165.1 uroporphyrinogen decarboxylase [Moraxella sp. K1630]MBE9595449.1 uroporphyrinogen decarboxylase [Moraxella sp. K2450]MDH9217908.1 uroporphyrinogen decarboxylase [Moraxella lacunata]MDI4483303.1 uroporphyrinogen decarboxylase [Moraxella lacunata]
MTQQFAPLKNDRLLRALRFEPVDTTPVWMMRQAGRYLPEYKEVRAKAGDFLSLCKDTDMATEVTLQPLRRFELDGAILFSDILTIPDAFGLGLYFEEGEGPKFKYTVRTPTDLERLPKIDVNSQLDYVMKAVTNIRKELNGQVPLFGFSGSPWTLATYMVEGGSSREFRHTKEMMYARPEFLHALLAKISDAVVDYLDAQILAGAQIVQIFDSWGGALGHRQFVEFSHNYNREIIAKLKTKHPDVPVVMFTKGGGLWLDVQADSQADCLGLDWTMPLDKARRELNDAQRTLTVKHKKLQHQKAIQGNLDPATLYGSPADIKKAVHDMLSDAYVNDKTGYVANFGHGITQWVKPEHARVFVDSVHEFRL